MGFDLVSPNGGGGQSFGSPGIRLLASGPYGMNGVLSPVILAGAVANYDPFPALDDVLILRLTPAVSGSILSGIARPFTGRVLYLVNQSTADTLTLSHDATSTAAFRFLCPSSTALDVPPLGVCQIWYDIIVSRWRVIAVSAGGGGSGSALPVASVYRDTDQTIGNGLLVAASFEAELYDTGVYWDLANPTRLTAAVAGRYLFTSNVRWNNATGGKRLCYYAISGGSRRYGSVYDTATTNLTQSLSVQLNLTAGQYVELILNQDSGGSVTITGFADEYAVACQVARLATA